MVTLEPVRDFSDIDLAAGGLAAIDIAPLAKQGALIISVPEAPVKDFRKGVLELRGQFGGESPVADGVGRAPVALGAALDVLCAACPAFNFEMWLTPLIPLLILPKMSSPQ